MILQERFGELGLRFADTPIPNYLLSRYSEKKVFLDALLEKLLWQFQTFNPLYLSSYLEVLSSQIASAGEVIAVLQGVRTDNTRPMHHTAQPHM